MASEPSTADTLTSRPSARTSSASTPPTDRCESTEPAEVEDSTDAALANEPMENTDPNEQTLPSEAHDQRLPTLSTEPSEAMLRNEFADHSDRFTSPVWRISGRLLAAQPRLLVRPARDVAAITLPHLR